MATMGRPTTNPLTIDRRNVVSEIARLAAITSNPATLAGRVQKMFQREVNADTFASATASAMLGNGLRATVRDAMVKAQSGQCFTCGVALDMPADRDPKGATKAVLFRLIPSILGANEEVAGTDAMAAGTLPGNVVATCATCSVDRNNASKAVGEVVCVTADSMVHDTTEGASPVLNSAVILYVWPSSPKGKAPKGADPMATRRAARLARIGW